MLEVSVKTLDSQNYFFTCEEDITVRGFKEHIAETVSVPAESQRLIYCGRVLQDDKILNDYDVNGKVIHLVQRAPPQPESRTSNDETQRQNNNNRWRQGMPRLHYQRHLHRNAMYLGTMSVPEEIIEGLPAPQINNSLSNSRLLAAKHMLNKAVQLMNRLDDPSVPLHPSPTENSASETPQQASAPEEEAEQDSNVNSNVNNTRNRMVQAASEIAAAFSAAALINIRLLHDNSEDGGSVTGTVNVIDATRPRQSTQTQIPEPEPEVPQVPQVPQVQRSEPQSAVPERPVPERSEPIRAVPERARPERAEAGSSEPERSERERSEPESLESERPEPERSNASTSNENQNARRRSTSQVPRPPQMAELLERLVSTQDRLRPYIERYRVLMLTDPTLTPGSGPESVTENQRIVDGVSECLHYLSHACHSLSDIIVDMGQQPPRNLRCRPIIIQHSAILQAGIPIQVESHMNIPTRNATNNNNATDEGNEATRPSSPTSGTSDQTPRSNNTNNRSMPQSINGQQNQPSLLGTLLNLPSNVELSMELSPQSTIDLNSPSAAEGSENEHGQSNNNNNNGNAAGASNFYPMAPPFVLIRDALRTVLSERHSLLDTSGGATISTPTNIPFVTIVGQQTMDIGTPNSGQSTQARSNIGTHPTTSTQTRSTARPHVLHPHPALNVGASMGQSLDFDPFLPCNSHHIRRTPPATVNSTSTSQSNQANQSTASESHSRSQSASQSSNSTRNSSHGPSINLADLAQELLENDGQAFMTGIGLPMTSDELSQVPNSDNAHNSFVGRGPIGGETHISSHSDASLFELLRLRNSLFEFTEQNFLNDLWLFLLRNITFGGITQLSLGQVAPLVNLRQPLREFLEHSFPHVSQTTLQERVVEQIVSLNCPLLQILIQPEEEITNRRVDIPATIEPLLRKFCSDILKLLFNNDVDNDTFAQEAVVLAKKLEEQAFAVFEYLIQYGQIRFGIMSSRFIDTMIRCVPMLFHQSLLRILTTRICDFTSRTSQVSQDEITALLIYQEEPSAPSAQSAAAESVNNSQLNSASASEPHVKLESASEEPPKLESQQQEQEAQSQPMQEQQSKQDVREETKEAKPEPMETELLDDKVVDDPMDLANGEEIPETFPGAENLPADWVPIIARDSVRQRRQVQMQALQGGPIPFSDAYLSGLPSKRRKLIEQQKPQLLVSPVPSGANAIAASLERLVREGIGHTQVGETEGAASAVASAPGVRSAFGQAIKDCLHPERLRTPDFPNAARFPNATKYFADGDKDKKEDTTPTTTSKPSK